MKVAWRKIGRIAQKVVKVVFMLEDKGVINVIPDKVEGKIRTGAAIAEGVIVDLAKKPEPQ